MILNHTFLNMKFFRTLSINKQETLLFRLYPKSVKIPKTPSCETTIIREEIQMKLQDSICTGFVRERYAIQIDQTNCKNVQNIINNNMIYNKEIYLYMNIKISKPKDKLTERIYQSKNKEQRPTLSYTQCDLYDLNSE